MQANYQWHQADSQDVLARQLADRLIKQINRAIDADGMAVIALSGGSTPKLLFKALSKRELDWSKVVITLVDERWVPPTHELSNAAFMQTNLLGELPASARFVPLYFSGADAQIPVLNYADNVLQHYCSVTESSVDKPRAFDAVILGMGSDGHTASFFPDADNVVDLVDANNPNVLLSCESPSTQVPRITWSLPMLLNTPMLALHITGVGKRMVFEQAAKGGDITELPIRSAILQTQTPLQVYYAD